MKHILLTVAFIFMFCGLPEAGYYKYHDKDGNVHYTENYSEVPESQRKNLKKYDEYVAPEKAAEPEDKRKLPDYEYKIEASNLKEEGAKLRQIKKDLEAEHAALNKEQADHESKRNDYVGTVARVKEFNAIMEDINKRLLLFEAKQKDFTKKVKDFNKRQAKQFQNDVEEHKKRNK